MADVDHPFQPFLRDPAHCQHCRGEASAPQHFTPHKGPIVPIHGFTCALVARLPGVRR